ncbi:MAG: FMN-binding protein [Eubacteriales bacterium]
MKKIRISALIMVVCLSIFFSGCGKNDNNESEVGADLEKDVIPYEQQKDDSNIKTDEQTDEKTDEKTDVKTESIPSDAAGVKVNKDDSQTAPAPSTATTPQVKNVQEKNEPAKNEVTPSTKQEPEKNEPAPPAQKYKDGTFTGSAMGYAANITVSVEIKGDVIKSINITSHKEDSPYIDDAKAVIGKILTSQSADVEAVSGATFSSNGIKGAVKQALANAKN